MNKPQQYEKLVSVDTAEHGGEALLPTFFRYAWELLRPGGVFLNHGIGIHSNMPVLGADFVPRYIFPDAMAMPINSTLQAAESG